MDDAAYRGMGAALHKVSFGRRLMARTKPQGLLHLGVLVIISLAVIFPILASLWQSLRAAFGVLPVLGRTKISFAPWAELLQTPGLISAARLSLGTGFAATGISLVLSLALVAAWHRAAPASGLAVRVLTPFLALPHAALAVGLAFVLAPSGWIARALAPVFDWALPPDFPTVADPYGAALILGLVIKEMPFLALVILAATTQIPLAQSMAAGRALGYGPAALWIWVILPQIWPRIRLPVYIVLAFGLSVIDMALILGPLNPPTFAVVLARMFSSPDVAQWLPASAGAIALLVMVAASFAALFIAEIIAARLGRLWAYSGRRRPRLSHVLDSLAFGAGAVLALGALSILALGLWSVAWRWAWPAVLPSALSSKAWGSAAWASPALATIVIAASATALALILAIAWLESEDQGKTGALTTPYAASGALIYLPLLIPQISFLFGMNILALGWGISGGFITVIWAHFLFVFPYVMIALAASWRALDIRYVQTAAALGVPRWRQLVYVKLPMLLSPVLAAFAIGMAVSVAQYLPTLFLGAGRVATLTTEAVALSSSSDRRVVAVVATVQAALPFVAYLAAFAIPAYVYRHRRDMTGAAT